MGAQHNFKDHWTTISCLYIPLPTLAYFAINLGFTVYIYISHKILSISNYTPQFTQNTQHMKLHSILSRQGQTELKILTDQQVQQRCN